MRLLLITALIITALASPRLFRLYSTGQRRELIVVGLFYLLALYTAAGYTLHWPFPDLVRLMGGLVAPIAHWLQLK